MTPAALMTLKLKVAALRLMRTKARKGHRRKRHRRKCSHRQRQPSQTRKRGRAVSFAHWLASTGRQVDYIRGDGNCFFRALSKEMYGSEDYHAEWREAVCDLIGAHPRVFCQFVDPGPGSLERHVGFMRRPGTWATSCEIYGTATLLRREVYVLAPSPSSSPVPSTTTSRGHAEKDYHWLLFSPCSLTSKAWARSNGGGGGGGGGSGPGVKEEGEEEEEDEEGDGDDEEDKEGVHPCYLTLCLTNGNHYDRITSATPGVCNCQMDPPSLDGAAVRMDSCPRGKGWEGVEELCWRGC
ncbi:uncharacterized protein LOC143291293 isoform X2 [Babylonia areolata]|uniref:uncharacterized protein LOC143291293 isoform X2 n=1 Tax=Babylonia areolata TaxID=304850 RepID=UPI003FD16D99